jgi:outer membrane lipoprotein-sorting protein
MKKLMSVSLLVLLLGFVNVVNAQDAEQKVKNEAKKVGNKSAEVGAKAKAKVTDKTYEDKVGPEGQTIYIDRHSKYYWINDKGHKVYISKAKLKNKQ